MMKLLSTISAFTLILMVSASAQEGLRRSDQRYMGEQQRRELYQQQRRRDYMRAERPDEPTLGLSLGGEQRIGVTTVAFFSCADRRQTNHETHAS